MVAVPKALPNMARPMARNVRTLSAFYCKEDGIPAPTGTVPTEAMRCNARMASVCCITRWKGNPRVQRATGHPALGANGISTLQTEHTGNAMARRSSGPSEVVILTSPGRGTVNFWTRTNTVKADREFASCASDIRRPHVIDEPVLRS